MDKTTLGLRPGSIIQDTYRVTDLLGEGGMGATFSGENLATGHPVAIKVITPEFARNAKSAELFRREATLLRTVQSDAVVRYETTMMDKSGHLYLVMEYISGRPLAHYLNKGAKLAPNDVLKLAKRLFGGLAAIHRLGIVHRDICPDNIMIPDEDILGAKLIDFGVASDTSGTEKSIIGDSFAGKISFASPEQLGIGNAQVGAASDNYSVGLVLMRVAGLTVPGAGKKLADAIDARRNDIVVSTESVPANLANFLNALLRADPKARAAAPLELLEAGLSAKPTDEKNHSNRQKKDPLVRKAAKPAPFADDGISEETSNSRGASKLMSILVAGIAVLALAAGGGYWLYQQNANDEQSGKAIDQAKTAKEAVQSADPLDKITKLVASGDEENLNAAFGALMAIARDENADKGLRGRASLMIARMYDPQTYDPKTSPFPTANRNAAVRFYSEARDHGAEGANSALSRLQE